MVVLGGGQAGGPRLGDGTERWPGWWPDEKLLPPIVVVRYAFTWAAPWQLRVEAWAIGSYLG